MALVAIGLLPVRAVGLAVDEVGRGPGPLEVAMQLGECTLLSGGELGCRSLVSAKVAGRGLVGVHGR